MADGFGWWGDMRLEERGPTPDDLRDVRGGDELGNCGEGGTC